MSVVREGSKLVEGTDYTLSYENNTKVDTATFTITDKDNYTGSVSKTFKISSVRPTSGHTYTIVCVKDANFALDIAAGSRVAKANADIYKRNGTEAQAFTLTKISDGSWQIKNYKGMVLDIAGGSKNNSANAQTYAWNELGAQKFTIRENSDGSLSFRCAP